MSKTQAGKGRCVKNLGFGAFLAKRVLSITFGKVKIRPYRRQAELRFDKKTVQRLQDIEALKPTIKDKLSF
jgi:hypothetical protein